MAADDFVLCHCGEKYIGERCDEQFAEHMASMVTLEEAGHGRAGEFKREDVPEDPPMPSVQHRRVMGNFGFDDDDEDDEPELRPQ